MWDDYENSGTIKISTGDSSGIDISGIDISGTDISVGNSSVVYDTAAWWNINTPMKTTYKGKSLEDFFETLERLERKITLMQQIIEVQGQEIQELKSKGDIK